MFPDILFNYPFAKYFFQKFSELNVYILSTSRTTSSLMDLLYCTVFLDLMYSDVESTT